MKKKKSALEIANEIGIEFNNNDYLKMLENENRELHKQIEYSNNKIIELQSEIIVLKNIL